MGLLQAGWTRCNSPVHWDTGELIQTIALDSDRAKTLMTCHGSFGHHDDVPSKRVCGYQPSSIIEDQSTIGFP